MKKKRIYCLPGQRLIAGVRFDNEMAKRIEAFRKAHFNPSVSQLVRMGLEALLEREGF